MEAKSKISLKESERRWKILLERTRSSTRRTPQTVVTGTVADQQEDPFDCTGLAVPPTFDLVQDVASHFVQQWRDLDQRKVVQQHVNTTEDPVQAAVNGEDNEDEDQEEDTSSQGRRKKPRVETPLSRPSWYEKHVRLPEHFDYATRRTEPPVIDDDNNNSNSNCDDGLLLDDRVISLTDPDQQTSYHEELWRLFQSIPTAQQLQLQLLEQEDTTDTDTTVITVAAAAAPGVNKLQHMQKLQDEITDTLKIYPRLDGHALSRLRLNDRHDPVVPVHDMDAYNDTTDNNNTTTTLISTIRFEIWRRQPRRGTTPDPHRMVLEFMGSQTLLDFHRAIVDLTEDFLWSSTDTTPTNTNTSSAGSAATVAAAAAAQNTEGACESVDGHENAVTNDNEDDSSSGFFFLEGAFYTTGSVDYTSPVVTWLESGSRKEQDQRAAYLGLFPSSTPEIHSMADTRLDELPLRLGIRYLYCCHGDVECSVLCTDRRLVPASRAKNHNTSTTTTTATTRYPIVHDIWMPSYLIPECEACQHCVAVIATSTECTRTGGHVALCEDCSRQLQLEKVVTRDQVQEYAVWKSQADLSTGAGNDSMF
jgi:hypothetical protein